MQGKHQSTMKFQEIRRRQIETTHNCCASAQNHRHYLSTHYKNHLLLVVPASQTELVEEGKRFPADQMADEGP